MSALCLSSHVVCTELIPPRRQLHDMIQSADIGGTVRLADFIATNKEAILAEWVTFAQSSGPAARTMDHAALRDHASEMLSAIVADLRTPQTDAEQSEK